MVVFPDTFLMTDSIARLRLELGCSRPEAELLAVRLWFNWASQSSDVRLVGADRALAFIIHDGIAAGTAADAKGAEALFSALQRAGLVQVSPSEEGPVAALVGWAETRDTARRAVESASTRRASRARWDAARDRHAKDYGHQVHELLVQQGGLPLEWAAGTTQESRQAFVLIARVDRVLGLPKRTPAGFGGAMIAEAVRVVKTMLPVQIEARLRTLEGEASRFREDVTAALRTFTAEEKI